MSDPSEVTEPFKGRYFKILVYAVEVTPDMLGVTRN